MPKEVYIPCTKSLFLASQAVNTETGEVIELTPVHKLLYFYCKDQYDFFISQGQKFFASWEDLCCATNIPYNSRKTKSVIADLQKMNLVVVDGGRKSNNKVVRRCDNKLVWELHNPQYTEFTSNEAEAKRVSDKKERLEKYKERKGNDDLTSYCDDSIDGVGNCVPDADSYETLPTITDKSIEPFKDDEDFADRIPF